MLTESDLQAEHRRLNKVCFDMILPDTTIHIGKSRYTKESIYGEYYPTGFGKGMILIDPRLKQGDEFTIRSTLAHEMIHQWQDLLGFRLDHYRVFKAWSQQIERLTGLIP